MLALIGEKTTTCIHTQYLKYTVKVRKLKFLFYFDFSDIEKIHEGLGDKLALFIQALSTFVTGFVVAFSQDWRLTLFLLAFTPFMAIAAAILSILTAAFTSKEQKQYASAGAVAEEVLSAIRTVFAFGGETHEMKR